MTFYKLVVREGCNCHPEYYDRGYFISKEKAEARGAELANHCDDIHDWTVEEEWFEDDE